MKLEEKLSAVGHLSTVLHTASTGCVLDYDDSSIVDMGKLSFAVTFGPQGAKQETNAHHLDATIEALNECVEAVNNNELKDCMIHTTHGVTWGESDRCTKVTVTITKVDED